MHRVRPSRFPTNRDATSEESRLTNSGHSEFEFVLYTLLLCCLRRLVNGDALDVRLAGFGSLRHGFKDKRLL